ncbi:MAG: type II secretion system F family protein [Pseudomonadota bacterium]
MDMTVVKPASLLLFLAATAFAAYYAIPRAKHGRLADKLNTDEVEASGQSRLIFTFKPFYSILMPIIRRLPLPRYKDRIKRYIITAGMESDIVPDDIIGFQIAAMLLFLFMGNVFFDNILLRIMLAVVGLCYPYLWLNEQKKNRQAAIVLSMPDIVDMLSLSVEAGLSFNAAVQKICDIYRQDKDPFVVELYLMDKNIRLGRSNEEALKIMASRVDLMELDSLCSTLIQANKMGSSIAGVLRSQAERMRSERFMKAEKLGAQASQKLLLPMMVFIFPIIFIIIFGPYVIQFILGK